MPKKTKVIKGVIDLDLRDIEIDGETWKNIGRLTWNDDDDSNKMYQVAICTREKDIQQISLNPRASNNQIQVRYREYQKNINHIDTSIFDTTPKELHEVGERDPYADSAAVAIGILNYRQQQMKNLH